MAFLFGNQASASKPTVPDAGLRVQSSVMGKVRTFGVGKTRISGNLIWQGDFKATPVQQQTSGGKGLGGTGCFPARTLIELHGGGTSPIESLRVGHVVLGFDDIGELGPTTITEVFVHEDHEVVEFYFENRPPHRTTTNHWFLLTDGTFASLEEGFHGEDLVAFDGSRLKLTGHRILPERETVYTFSCEPANTFIADGIRVHNLGGGGKSGATSYTYSVAVAIGLADGPTSDLGITAVYLNVPTADGTSTVPGAVDPSSLGFTEFFGTYTQDAWFYTAFAHPNQNLAYRGLTYVAAAPFDLGSNNTLPNMSFEVIFWEHGSLPTEDSDAATWVRDLLLNEFHGAGFPNANTAAMTSYREYTIATGMCVSDAMVSSTALNSYLTDLVKATNAEMVFDSGVLDIIPYGDEIITANGSTYIPTVLAGPVATFTDDDYIYDNTAKGPVRVKRPKQRDVMNVITVEYLDRDNMYNPTPVEAKDEASMEVFGIRRADPAVYHFFALGSAAQQSAYLLLNRQALRNIFEFTVSGAFIYVGLMDYVAINDTVLGLVDKLALVKEIQEDENGNLTFTCEEYLGNAHSPVYALPTYVQPPALCDPGWTDALIVDSTFALDPDGPSLMVSANGMGAGFNGQRGWVTFWYNPIGRRNGDTLPLSNPDDVYTMILANSNGAGIGRPLAIFENSSSPGDFSITLIIDVYSSHGGTLLPRYVLMCRTIPTAIPPGGVAIGIEWDGHYSGEWDAHMYINGVDVTDTTWMNANSGYYTDSGFHGPTLNMNVPLDGSYPIPYGRDTVYSLLSFPTYITGEAELSQAWVLLSPCTMLTLGDYWSSFFDANNSPLDLGVDGSLPILGVRPILYYPHDTTNIGVAQGLLGNSSIVSPVVTGTYTNATTIPQATTGYQAIGLHVGTASGNSITNELIVTRPDTNYARQWGGANVWVSVDGGSNYAMVGIVKGPTTIGYLTADIPSTTEDPITSFDFKIDITPGQALQVLPQPGTAAADAGSFPMAIVDMGAQEYQGMTGGTVPPAPVPYELFSYAQDTQITSLEDELHYIRPGILGSSALAWSAAGNSAMGIKVAPATGPNVLRIPYTSSLVGTLILYQLQSFNAQGTGKQDLSTVPVYRYYLQGPGNPSTLGTFTVTNPSSHLIVAAWTPPANAPSFSFTYDLAWQSYDVTGSAYNFGALTFYLDPVSTTNVATGYIFSARFDAGEIDPTDAGIVAGTELFIKYNDASVGTFTVVFRITTVQANVTYILETPSTPLTIGTPVALGINWDGTGTTWTASIYANNIDVTDYAAQAANSSHGGTPGTNMGVTMDDQYVMNDTYGAWWIGDNGWTLDTNGFPVVNNFPPNNQQFGLSQLWVGAGEAIDLSTAPNWALFFDGSNLPISLGILGEAPLALNHVPYVYFDTDPTRVGHNSGQGPSMEPGALVSGGVINTPYLPNGTVVKGTMIGNASYIGAAAGAEFGFGYLARGLPSSSTTLTSFVSIVGNNQLFELRTVTNTGVTGPWVTDMITTT